MHNIVACIARFLLGDAIIIAKLRIGCHDPRKILLLVILMILIMIVMIVCHSW